MYCKHCGKEIDDDSKICKYCGNDVSSNINRFSFNKKMLRKITYTTLKVILVFLICLLLTSIVLFIDWQHKIFAHHITEEGYITATISLFAIYYIYKYFKWLNKD